LQQVYIAIDRFNRRCITTGALSEGICWYCWAMHWWRSLLFNMAG